MRTNDPNHRDLTGHYAEYDEGRAEYRNRKQGAPMGGRNPYEKGSLAAEAFNEGWFDEWSDDPMFGKGKP